MIKRAFKLKNDLGFGQHDVEKLQGEIINDDIFILIDKDTNAVQIITHINGRKEYLVLIPGKPSFIVMNIDEKGKDKFIYALKELAKIIRINDKAVKEVEVILQLYLSLEKIDKGVLKQKVRELIEENAQAFQQIRNKNLIDTLIPFLAKGFARAIINEIFTPNIFPEEVLRTFSIEELYEIFEEELILDEVESYALRILKNKLLVDKN